MRKPRINFIRDQLEVLKQHPLMKATEIVQNFRLHYANTASFASSISRFKSELRKAGTVSDLEFLSQLKPTPEEMQKVNEKNRKHLIDKCKRSVTLNNCGDNLIMYFKKKGRTLILYD
jgi:primosomal protein N'